MKTPASLFKQFTLGIGEEFQIVDPHTRQLRSHVSEILEEGKMLLGELMGMPRNSTELSSLSSGKED